MSISATVKCFGVNAGSIAVTAMDVYMGLYPLILNALEI